MSGWAEERKILQAWFTTQWNAGTAPNNAANVPIEYAGVLFDTPADGRPWISMDIIGSLEGSQITLGTPALSRYVGLVQFTISVPIGVAAGSDQRAREIADALDKLWKGRRFQTANGRIRCRVPGLHPLGNIGNRWVAVLTIPYLRDEIETTPPPVGLA